MSVLSMYTEDIDFPNGGTMQTSTTAGRFRSGYGRCAICPTRGTVAKSLVFPGGALTSAWLSCQLIATGAGNDIEKQKIGFGLHGTNKGLFIGSDNAVYNRLALHKWDGTTDTSLASESGTSYATSIFRLDMQVVNYGATASVNIYLNQGAVPIITYSGDVTVSGMTNFDSVFLVQSAPNSDPFFSEILVTSDDSRAYLGVATLALTGAGTTDQWTGAYSDINGTAFSDATPNNTATTAQTQEYNVTDLPAGTFQIAGVKITARGARGANPAIAQVKLGYKNGANTGFGTGATKVLSGAYSSVEQLDVPNDPTTGAVWQQADINALQLDMVSV